MDAGGGLPGAAATLPRSQQVRKRWGREEGVCVVGGRLHMEGWVVGDAGDSWALTDHGAGEVRCRQEGWWREWEWRLTGGGGQRMDLRCTVLTLRAGETPSYGIIEFQRTDKAIGSNPLINAAIQIKAYLTDVCPIVS